MIYGVDFMALKQYECPNCGSRLQVSADGKVGLCPACDSRFLIEDDVIRHRVEGTVTVDGLTSRKQLHKRAEQFMQLGQYADAAALFHEIIESTTRMTATPGGGLRAFQCRISTIQSTALPGNS